MHSDDNSDGPLTKEQAAGMTKDLTKDQDAFYDQFVTDFFSANGRLKVTEEQRQEALALTTQAAPVCTGAFGNTDFRDDLATIKLPTLVIHGDADAVVFYEDLGARTHAAIPESTLHVISGAAG